MACLGCGKQIEKNSDYLLRVGGLFYHLCEGCFKKSGAVEGANRLNGGKNEHEAEDRKLLEWALTVVETQAKNEALWSENTTPKETILQRELRWLHSIIKKQCE